MMHKDKFLSVADMIDKGIPTSKADTFDFSPHRIQVQDRANRIFGCWLGTGDPSHTANLDQCRIETYDDIVGWVSEVKTEIMEMGLRILLAIFQGQDLMPSGVGIARELAHKGMRSFLYCGFSLDDIVNQLVPMLAPKVESLWTTSYNADDHTDRFILMLKGAGNGVLVGRLTCNREIKWRVHFPMGTKDIIDVKGTGFLQQESAETFLLARLISEILAYLRSPVHA